MGLKIKLKGKTISSNDFKQKFDSNTKKIRFSKTGLISIDLSEINTSILSSTNLEIITTKDKK